jgi:hypothetical protein
MTYGGTGTPATPPHQVSAADLIANARIALADVSETIYADEDLLSFLNEAVREYSQQLPRISTTIITTVAGTVSYALPWDTTNVLHVQFDGDEDPVTRMSYKRTSFNRWMYYDFLPRLDLTNPPTLLLSIDPTASASLNVTYTHPHDHELTATSYVTVPADHHHVLLGYVLFAAARQLMNIEQATPTGDSSLLMAQLQTNTRRAELTYLNALNRILQASAGRSDTAVWRMDGFDRVY